MNVMEEVYANKMACAYAMMDGKDLIAMKELVYISIF
jgi:hypothetical protein